MKRNVELSVAFLIAMAITLLVCVPQLRGARSDRDRNQRVLDYLAEHCSWLEDGSITCPPKTIATHE